MSATDLVDGPARSLRRIAGERGVVDGDRRDVPAALIIAGVTAAAVAVLGFLATRSLAVAGVCAAATAAGVTLAAVVIAPR